MQFIIKGFRINLKPSFFVMCGLFMLLGYGRELCILIFSVTLHEMAHIFAAALCGIRAEGVIITPIGQQAIINGMENISFVRRIFVVVVGPLINLLLWFIFDSQINLALFILNTLPVYPLDGGRLLHYVLGYCIGVLRANRVQSFLSKAMAIMLFLFGILQVVLYSYNVSLICIGLYLIKINRREYINMTFSFYRSVIYRNDKKVLAVRSFAAGESICLKTIVYRLGWDYYTVVYLRDKAGCCEKYINEEQLISYILRHNINHKLRDVFAEN